MKINITELIGRLQTIREKEGDIEVTYASVTEGGLIPVVSVVIAKAVKSEESLVVLVGGDEIIKV